MAANAPAPRPCLKVLPVGCSTQDYPYFFALTESSSSLGCIWGVSANKHQTRSIVEEAQGGLGKVRLASVHRFRSCSAKCYDSDAPLDSAGARLEGMACEEFCAAGLGLVQGSSCIPASEIPVDPLLTSGSTLVRPSANSRPIAAKIGRDTLAIRIASAEPHQTCPKQSSEK